jgi:hypothetical protein
VGAAQNRKGSGSVGAAARFLLSVGALLGVTGIALVYYDAHRSRPIGFVTGTVVTFETDASDDRPPMYRFYGRLDDGAAVVHADNPARALTPVGRRVELAQYVGPVTGTIRYRLQRVL